MPGRSRIAAAHPSTTRVPPLLVRWALLKILLFPFAGAAGDSPVPANPNAGAVPLTQAMRLPRRTPRPATHEELCRLLVTEQGTIDAHRCETVRSDKKLAQRIPYEVYRSIERAQIAPAELKGSPVAVIMTARVLVHCTADGCDVEALANCGLHAERLGEAYIEAQEVLQSSGTWYDRRLSSRHCSAAEADGKASCSDYSVYQSQALVEVSAEGELGAVIHGDVEEDGIEPLGNLDQALAGVRFIPTLGADGQPVAASALVTPMHSVDSDAIGRPHCVEVDTGYSKLSREFCYSEQEYHEWRPGPQHRMSGLSRMSDFLDLMSRAIIGNQN